MIFPFPFAVIVRFSAENFCAPYFFLAADSRFYRKNTQPEEKSGYFAGINGKYDSAFFR
jgi:hypothetical protein